MKFMQVSKYGWNRIMVWFFLVFSQIGYSAVNIVVIYESTNLLYTIVGAVGSVLGVVGAAVLITEAMD